jgi:hypothetical protein
MFVLGLVLVYGLATPVLPLLPGTVEAGPTATGMRWRSAPCCRPGFILADNPWMKHPATFEINSA